MQSIDNGRYPDGTCEGCGSLLHGLYDCLQSSPIERYQGRKTEQASRQPGDKALNKKLVKRARRRAESKDPESAPTSNRYFFRGYTS